MTTVKARLWLVKASFFVIAGNLVFFLLAPWLGYPLQREESPRLLQIIIPVFTGYLVAAIHFVFRQTEPIPARSGVGIPELLRWIVIGPVMIFLVWSLSAILAFGFSNRVSAPGGTGLSVDDLASQITFALAFLTATTGAVISYLFGRPNGEPHDG